MPRPNDDDTLLTGRRLLRAVPLSTALVSLASAPNKPKTRYCQL